MQKQDIFIQKFKEIENLIPKLPNTPIDANFKWYEDNTLDNEKKQKLYICRVLRNYIQHNKDYLDFVSVSDDMLKFLDEINNEIKSKLTQAKDEMIPLKKMIYCKKQDKALEVLTLMLKKNLEYIPILDENNIVIGLISIYDLTNFVLENKTKNLSTFTKIKKILYKCNKLDTLMEEIINLKKNDENLKYIFITEQGTTKSKVLGYFKF